MSCISHELFLLICISFLLTYGGALMCRVCLNLYPLEPCEAPKTCEVNSETGTCILVKVYKDGELFKIVQDCLDWETEEENIDNNDLPGSVNIVASFCSESDFCNEYIYK